MNSRLTFVHALSPLHAGTGQGAGVIDLPIAREKATGLPFLPGSSLKGALRTRCFTNEPGTGKLEQNNEKLYTRIFGAKEIQESDNQASLAQFTDQRLLLLPIRSLAGTFAWVTSPFVLQRLLRDIEDTHYTPPAKSVPQPENTEQCLVTKNTGAIVLNIKDEKPMVYLEDLNLAPQEDKDKLTLEWAEWIGRQIFPHSDIWQELLNERFCVVHDDVFNFLLNTATEITARIKLQDDSKTVQQGGLWYEEALPTETILSGIVLATSSRDKEYTLTTSTIFEKLNDLTKQTIQLGGKSTVGRGLCHVQLTRAEGQDK